MVMKQSAGDILVASILSDIDSQGLCPDARELELLERARVLATRLEHLEATIAREGETYVHPKTGITYANPLLSEVRASTALLTRVLSGVQMSAVETGKQVAKVRAGQASWAARVAREQSG